MWQFSSFLCVDPDFHLVPFFFLLIRLLLTFFFFCSIDLLVKKILFFFLCLKNLYFAFNSERYFHWV